MSTMIQVGATVLYTIASPDPWLRMSPDVPPRWKVGDVLPAIVTGIVNKLSAQVNLKVLLDTDGTHQVGNVAPAQTSTPGHWHR